MKSIVLHPMFVHFPIAFYFLEALFLILWVARVNDEYRRSALFVFRLAYFMTLGALVTGWLDSGGAQNIKGAVARHFFSALSLFFYATLRAFLWRFSGRFRHSFYKKIQVASSVLGCFLVALTAFLGGKLVYGS